MSQTLTVRILGDASQFSRTIKGVDTQAKGLGGKLKGSLGPALMAGGTAAVIGFGKASIDAFGQSKKVAGQTAAVLKSTGKAAGVSAGHIAKMSGKLQKLSGVEDEAIQTGQNMLLTFNRVRNEAGKGNDIFDQATAAALDMSVALGQDLTTSATQLGKALQDPAKGAAALSKAGSLAKDDLEKLKEMAKSGVPVLEQQKFILAALAEQYGGSAEAAGKTRTASERLTLQMGELQEKIGAGVVPILDKVTNGALAVGNGFNALPGPVKASIGVMAGLAVSAVVVSKLADAAKSVKAGFDAANTVISKTPAAVNGVSSAATLLAGKVGAVTTAFQAMAGAAGVSSLAAGGALVAAAALGAVIGTVIGRAISDALDKRSDKKQTDLTNKENARLQRIQDLTRKSKPRSEANPKGEGKLSKAEQEELERLKKQAPKFAGGVRNFRGGLALVGERGPELVKLPRGSDVYPHGTAPATSHVININGPIVAYDPTAAARQIEEKVRLRRLVSSEY